MSPPIRLFDDMPWLDDPDVRRARQFATAAHGNQKYGRLDYVVHLDDVVAQLHSVGATKDELIAGYLHDVPEDTAVTREELVSEFGNRPTTIAFSVGSREHPRAKAQAQIVHQLSQDLRGGLVKLCDRVCNMTACLEDGKLAKLKSYIDEMPMYEPVFKRVVDERKSAAVTALFQRFQTFSAMQIQVD